MATASTKPPLLYNRKRQADEPSFTQAEHEAAARKDREESTRHSVIPALPAHVTQAKHVADGGDNDSWWLFGGARRVLKEERVAVIARHVKLDAEQAKYKNTTGRLADLPHREYVVSLLDEKGVITTATVTPARVLCFQSKIDALETTKCAMGVNADYWNKHEHIEWLDKLAGEARRASDTDMYEEQEAEDEDKPLAVLLIGKLKQFERSNHTKVVVHRVVAIYDEDEARFHELNAKLYASKLGGK